MVYTSAIDAVQNQATAGKGENKNDEKHDGYRENDGGYGLHRH